MQGRRTFQFNQQAAVIFTPPPADWAECLAETLAPAREENLCILSAAVIFESPPADWAMMPCERGSDRTGLYCIFLVYRDAAARDD